MRLRDLLIPLMLISCVLTGIMPTTDAVTISPGTYFETTGGNMNFTVSHTMSFSSIRIETAYVIFNESLNLYSYNPPTWIELDHLNSSLLDTGAGDLALEFNYTSYEASVYFWIAEFRHSHQYRVMRNGVNWIYPTSSSIGAITFTDTLPPGTVNIKIYDYVVAAPDTTQPVVTINFAGNHSDKGGPYWLPPGESTALSGVNLYGYYANSSYQKETWMYMNLTVTDDVAVSSVGLHWKNLGTGVWDNTSSFTKGGTSSYWALNKTGVASGKYSFDVLATDSSGNVKLLWWNKTGLGGSYTRRSVYLAQTPVDITYTPLYFTNYKEYSTSIDFSKKDRLVKDQGTNGGGKDTGFIQSTVPSDVTNIVYCTQFIGSWFNESSSITPFTLNNIYFHLWGTSNTGHFSEIGYRKTKEQNINTFDSYVFSNTSRSSITYDNGLSSYADNYSLFTAKLSSLSVSMTDNDIYNLLILFNTRTPGYKYPSLICNRSYTSFILLNIPSNASLNVTGDTDGDLLSDWTELYRSYTNPFLSDTDDDGVNDSSEYYGGSDPNDYTEYTTPSVFVPTVFTNASTSVEETTATLNGWLADDGGVGNSTIYENYIVGDDGHLGFLHTEKIAQTFTAISNHNITSVQLLMFRAGSVSTIYIYIMDSTKSIIYSQGSLDGSTLTTDSGGEWKSFNVTKYLVTSGTTYNIVVYSPGSSDYNLRLRRDASSPSYAGGSMWIFNGYTWGEYTNIDLMFKILDIPLYVNFEYGTTTGYGTNTVSQSKSSGESFFQSISSLSQGTLYHFRAKAVTSVGTGYGSDMTFLTKPLEPTGLTVGTIHNTSIALSWVKGIGANNTRIQRITGGLTTIYNGTGTSFVDTGLTPGVVYNYSATSYSSNGVLFQWSDANDTISELTRPNPPSNTHITIYTNNTANLSWVKGTGANNTIVIFKSTGFPTSITDGTQVYNGTGTHYIATVTNGTAYYYKAWSYDEWGLFYHYSDNGTEFTNITGGGFIINCYDETNHSNLTFNVLISNPDGSQTYQKTGCTNPEVINASLCTQGAAITVFISSTDHQLRTYILSLYPGIIYTLNAYLPHNASSPGEGGEEAAAELYVVQVKDVAGNYLSDVLVHIKRYINSSHSFIEIGTAYTDSSGSCDFYLIPSIWYKVYLSKDGYDSSVNDWITDPYSYGIYYPKIFVMTSSLINVTIPPSFYDVILFNGTMFTNGSIYINYVDSMGETINAQFYMYEVYNFTFTLVDTQNIGALNSYQYWVSGINASRQHMVTIRINHTTLGYTNASIYLNPVNNSLYHDPAIVEDASKDVFGDFDLGYVRFFIEWLPFIGILIILGRIEAGMGIFGGVLYLCLIGKFFNDLPVELWQVIPVLIIFAILWYIVTKGKFRL